MAVLSVKPHHWGPAQRDVDGHRTYKVTHLVRTTDTGGAGAVGDGPAVIMASGLLPAVGSAYAYGNDLDLNATCTPEVTIRPVHTDGEHPFVWHVENTYTTKPVRRCQDEQFENPLLEPQKVSGSFTRYTVEIMFDRFGNPLKSSSHEPLRGPNVEFDANRPTVRIEQNVVSLNLPLVAQLIDSVNSSTMWGLPARTVKLANCSWEQKFYGTCAYYFTRAFDFEIRYDGWDRTLLDEGSKVLHGDWVDGRWTVKNFPDGTTPDPDNPAHFVRFHDQKGNVTNTILDGSGLPYDGTEAGTSTAGGGSPGTISVQAYASANLFLLGIPANLEVPTLPG